MDRRIAVILFVMTVAIAAACFAIRWNRCPTATYPRLDEHGKTVPISDEVKQAVAFYVQRLDTVATASLALLGLAWAFLLKDDYRVRVHGIEGHALFALINLALLGSYYCYWRNYGLIVSDLYSSEPSVDIFAPIAEMFTYWQHAFLLIGLVGLGILVFVFSSKANSRES